MLTRSSSENCIGFWGGIALALASAASGDRPDQADLQKRCQLASPMQAAAELLAAARQLPSSSSPAVKAGCRCCGGVDFIKVRTTASAADTHMRHVSYPLKI